MKTVTKRTKILATLGPATNNYEAIESLIIGGTDGFRLNFSHGEYAERDEQIKWIRTASDKLGKSIAVLQDLQGPKIRLGALRDNNFVVKNGDEIVLDNSVGEHDGGHVLPVQYNLATKVKVGEQIYIFDGKVRTEVLAIESETAIRLKVQNDGVLMSKKGINLPDTDFGGDILTAKDLRDIEYGLTQDIDFVALSFVQRAEDIVRLREILNAGNSRAKIIAKIETKAAIEPEAMRAIVEVSDGVMVARGDLAVEAGAEIVPVMQRRLVSLCRRYGKLSIVATQMMASMVDSPEPTRAEVSDVATAVIQGADTVMLSDETANGSYPLETVAAMQKTILYTQENAHTVEVKDHILTAEVGARLNAISEAAVQLAENLGVSAIVAETKSGATAVNIASYRPSLPIVSVTSEARVAQQLALYYANVSYLRPDGERAGHELAKDLQASGWFGEQSAMVIIVSGRQPGLVGGTDTIKVRVLG